MSHLPYPSSAAAGHSSANKPIGPHDGRSNVLTTAEIESAIIYGPEKEAVGSVRALWVGSDGRITDAVIDIGDCVGIGAHTVLVPFAQLTVLRKSRGDAVRIFLDATRAELRAMPVCRV